MSLVPIAVVGSKIVNKRRAKPAVPMTDIQSTGRHTDRSSMLTDVVRSWERPIEHLSSELLLVVQVHSREETWIIFTLEPHARRLTSAAVSIFTPQFLHCLEPGGLELFVSSSTIIVSRMKTKARDNLRTSLADVSLSSHPHSP
jgi:hypothetical protein